MSKRGKSVYTFDAGRCKKAIEKLSDLVYDASDPEMGDAMDDLVTDIEDLHRRAQEFDMLLDALGEMVDDDEIYELVLTYKPDEPTEDLSL